MTLASPDPPGAPGAIAPASHTLAIRRVCVYCGSSSGTRAVHRDAAAALGSLLATRGIELVYGGGHVGLMGTVADAVLSAGGRVTGVIPKALMERELGHRGIQDLRVVADMHERKMTMANLADAFVALPGGWGTIEELTEMATWRQLAIHVKPIGVLNSGGYYGALLAFAASMIDEGFVRPEHRDLLRVESDPATLLDRLHEPVAAPIDKWVGHVPPKP